MVARPHPGKPRLAAESPLWGGRGNLCARGALLLSALSASAGVAAQQHAPSDDELRAIYCVEVIRAEIGVQHHLISASDAAAISAPTPALRQQWLDTSSELLQGLGRLELLRYRLQRYMLPRIAALDSSALAAAVRQGEADVEESGAAADRIGASKQPRWLPPPA
jgi:hypothetical protein